MFVIKSATCDETVNGIKFLKQSLASSYGPSGRTKLFANLPSGEIKCGSSSSLLFSSELVNTDDSIISLIISTAKQHLKVHYDFGLYCLLLSLTLVESSYNLDYSSCFLAECYRYFLHKISSHIQDVQSCPIVKRIDIQKSDSLLLILKSVINSKPSLCLNKTQRDSLAVLMLKSFVNCLPNDPANGRIIWPSIVFSKNLDFDDCKLYNGLLLDLHHYSQDCIQGLFKGVKLKPKIWVVTLNVSLTVNDFVKTIPGQKEPVLQSVKEIVANQMKSFVQKLAFHNISVVLNQKCISDELKYLMRTLSIVAIDRIGQSQMNALKHVTKAIMISSLNEDIEKCKSYVDEFKLETIKSKSFVFVNRHDASFSTAVVCCGNLTVLDDVKHVCWASISALDKTIRNQLVFEGISALEEYLIGYLESNCKTFPKSIGCYQCSVTQWQICLEAFCSSLKFMKDRCTGKCDGASNTVYDCYESKLNAFVVAVETACIALEIGYQIHS